jgi:GntR family transcriptional regulator
VTKAYKELEIQNILETQQGTGTFIGKISNPLPVKEKAQKLQNICNEFITIAQSYGFTKKDLIIELQKE